MAGSGPGTLKENDTLFLALDRGGSAIEAVRSDADQSVPEYFSRLRHQASAAQQAAAGHTGDIFLMPASVYSQSLLALGLDEQNLAGLLDNVLPNRAAGFTAPNSKYFRPRRFSARTIRW